MSCRIFTRPQSLSQQITYYLAQMVKHLHAMRETWVQFLGLEDPLEKEMAIHSSTLAWKIPWMEQPDRLQSMGSQRVRHDWATSLSLQKTKQTSKRKTWQHSILTKWSESTWSIVGQTDIICFLMWYTEKDTTPFVWYSAKNTKSDSIRRKFDPNQVTFFKTDLKELPWVSDLTHPSVSSSSQAGHPHPFSLGVCLCLASIWNKLFLCVPSHLLCYVSNNELCTYFYSFYLLEKFIFQQAQEPKQLCF